MKKIFTILLFALCSTWAVGQQYIVSTLAGTGIKGSTNGPFTSATFNSPQAICSGIYIADTYNNCIRVISGNTVTNYAGSGSSIPTDGNINTSGLTPISILNKNGTLYFTQDDIIRKITSNGSVVTIAGKYGFTGDVNATGSSARFNRPTDIAIDNLDNLYVIDYNNYKIKKISPNGLVTTLAGSGVKGYVDGVGTAASFSQLGDIVIDKIGNLYVTDNAAIRKITPDGIVTTFAGLNTGFYTTLDGIGTNARFKSFDDIAIDINNNLYVLSNGEIRKITSDAYVTTLKCIDKSGTDYKSFFYSNFYVDDLGSFYVAKYIDNIILKIDLDTDSDGIPDIVDLCDNTISSELLLINSSGCGPSERDTDGDGIKDNLDICTNTPLIEKSTVNSQGCSASQRDTDSDGINDKSDICPNTPLSEKSTVNAQGCSISQRDTDADGINDKSDICPNTPLSEKSTVNAQGCSISQQDADNDGVPNGLDVCANTPTSEVSTVNAQGCSVSQRDTDSDGVTDNFDICSNTPIVEKSTVNAQGCSISQRDTDSDGVKDNLDICANTPIAEKSTVNAQGCSISQRDTDGDGVKDNIDQCNNTDLTKAYNKSINLCFGDQISINGKSYNSSGTYSFLQKTTTGCDSNIVLKITTTQCASSCAKSKYISSLYMDKPSIGIEEPLIADVDADSNLYIINDLVKWPAGYKHPNYTVTVLDKNLNLINKWAYATEESDGYSYSNSSEIRGLAVNKNGIVIIPDMVSKEHFKLFTKNGDFIKRVNLRTPPSGYTVWNVGLYMSCITDNNGDFYISRIFMNTAINGLDQLTIEKYSSNGDFILSWLVCGSDGIKTTTSNSGYLSLSSNKTKINVQGIDNTIYSFNLDGTGSSVLSSLPLKDNMGYYVGVKKYTTTTSYTVGSYNAVFKNKNTFINSDFNDSRVTHPIGVVKGKNENVYILNYEDYSSNLLKLKNFNYVKSLGEFSGIELDGVVYNENNLGDYSSCLSWPEGIAKDKSENIYISSGIGHSVIVLDSLLNPKFRIGIRDTSVFDQYSRDSLLNTPVGIAINDNLGLVYVADRNNKKVKVFDLKGKFKFAFAAGSNIFSPEYIAIDTKNFIYVTSGDEVFKFTSLGVFIKKWGGTGTGNGQFKFAGGLDFDSKENLYVVDINNRRIQKFDTLGNYISQVGKSGFKPQHFAFPIGLFVDKSEDLIYVAEKNNQRIQILSTCAFSSTSSTCSTTVATQPSVTATKTTITTGESITLSVATGTLNCATAWKWYSGSCGGTLVGTGSSITVSPSFNTTYYVRGEGSSVASGTCGSLAISVTQAPYGFKVTANGLAGDGSSVNDFTKGTFAGAYIVAGSTATVSAPVVDNGAIKYSLKDVKLYGNYAIKVMGLVPVPYNIDLSKPSNQRVAIRMKASAPFNCLLDLDDPTFESYFNYNSNRPKISVPGDNVYRWYVFDLAGLLPRVPSAVKQIPLQYVSSTPFTGDIWIDEMLVGEFVPTISQTSSLSNFVTNVNTPSKAQSINISGTSLIDLINVNAPSGYEITTDTLGVWSSQLQVSGTNAKLFVRAKAQSASNAISGNLTLTSTAAVNVTIPLNGSVINGINDKLWSNQIKLIPNPVIDYLEISSEQKSISKYTIYSSLGEIVLSNSNWTETEKIDVRHLPSGMYMIKVADYENAKIIKFVKH